MKLKTIAKCAACSATPMPSVTRMPRAMDGWIFLMWLSTSDMTSAKAGAWAAKLSSKTLMWHGNAQSDARRTVEKFRELSKEDRDAVVKFIDAI